MRNTSLALFNALVIVLVILMAAACPNKEQTRDKTIRAALIATNVARDEFTKIDAGIQAAIVDAAKTLEDGKAALAKYRTGAQTGVLNAFEVAYRAIAAAAVLKDEQSLSELLRATKLLKEAIDAAKEIRP